MDILNTLIGLGGQAALVLIYYFVIIKPRNSKAYQALEAELAGWVERYEKLEASYNQLKEQYEVILQENKGLRSQNKALYEENKNLDKRIDFLVILSIVLVGAVIFLIIMLARSQQV